MSDINFTLNSNSGLRLRLKDLKSGSLGITPAFGEGLAEAASVCLEDQGHSSPTPMQISGEVKGNTAVEWDGVSGQIRRCWNDDEEATEYGAYGIASLLVPQLSGLQVVERSKRGTGFDFWLGTANESASLFQNRARLEVSGIRAGSEAMITSRVRQKLKQTERLNTILPAVVVVVEFGKPQSQVVKR